MCYRTLWYSKYDATYIIMDYLLRGLDKDLWKKVKILSVFHDTTIKDLIIKICVMSKITCSISY